MKRLFILGAGFSKAVFTQMPILGELSSFGIEWERLPVKKDDYEGLKDDVEQLLTYLYQRMPWKTPEEVHLDIAAFLMIKRDITAYISNCESGGFSGEIPHWALEFVNYLHNERSVVATLNYDTILETLATSIATGDPYSSYVRHVSEDDIYELPIAHLYQRKWGVFGAGKVDTFRMLKLHGSVNWFALEGAEGEAVEQIYYKPAAKMQPVYEGDERRSFTEKGKQRWEAAKGYKYIIPDEKDSTENIQKDLVPLIIPPVADKSIFYQTRLVKVLWSEFRTAIEQAEEVYCVGYSLPKTDLTIRLFLRSVLQTQPKRVFIVNRATGKGAEDLLSNYKEVFRGCDIDQTYLGLTNAVQSMVEGLGR